MQALLFDHHIPRYLLSKTVYRLGRRWWSVDLAPLRLLDLPLPQTERPGWVRLRVRLSGICGSDLSALTGTQSLYFEPEATYPFVPGHEIAGEIDAAPEGVRDARGETLQPGDRVAVWPVVGCAPQGFDPPCAECATGWEGFCRRRGEAWPGYGLSIGFNRETGGGWAEACLAHGSQLWKLSERVSDEDAVALEPAAVALGALTRTPCPAEGRTLVIGGGTIGMQVGLLHRALGMSGSCQLLVRYPSQEAWAERQGLEALSLDGGRSFRDWALASGYRRRRIFGYGEVMEGPFDRVIVAAGARLAFRWALASVRPGGSIGMLAAPARLRGFDPSPVWYREITIRGLFDYAPIPWQGGSLHPYDILIPALEEGRLDLGRLVTQRFPLERYREAVAQLVSGRSGGAMKVVFDPASRRIDGAHKTTPTGPR